MQAQKKGVLFIFSGPSGVGKGTLKEKLYREFDGQVKDSISATTREPRDNERNGREYFFITRQEFEKRIANNDFLEHAEFTGNLYGTPRSYVMDLLERGINVVLEIEVQGAAQVKARMPQSVSVFILPPSMEVLERRLRERGTESEERIRERLAQAAREIPHAPDYDYQIVNGDDLEASYQALRRIYLEHTRF